MKADEARRIANEAILHEETQRDLLVATEENNKLEQSISVIEDTDFLYDIPEVMDEMIAVAAENGYTGISFTFNFEDVPESDLGDKLLFCEGEYGLAKSILAFRIWTTTATGWISLHSYVDAGYDLNVFGPALDLISSLYEMDGYVRTYDGNALRRSDDSMMKRFSDKILGCSSIDHVEFVPTDAFGKERPTYVFALTW